MSLMLLRWYNSYGTPHLPHQYLMFSLCRIRVETGLTGCALTVCYVASLLRSQSASVLAGVCSDWVMELAGVCSDWAISILCARVLRSFSCVRLFVTPWTVACQAPLSMGFSRQEYRSGLPWPLPRNLPDPGIEAKSPAISHMAGGFFITEPPGPPIHTALVVSYFVCFLKI